MKKVGMIGAILLLATTPANLLIWGGLLIVCTGMALAAEGDLQKARPGRAGDTAGRGKSAKRLSYTDIPSIPQDGEDSNQPPFCI